MTKNQELATFFKAHPGQWFDGRALEFAGRYAWRSRTSDLRRAPFCMDIQNRQRTVRTPDRFTGKMKVFTVSEYRYVPAVPRDLIEVAEHACNVPERGV